MIPRIKLESNSDFAASRGYYLQIYGFFNEFKEEKRLVLPGAMRRNGPQAFFGNDEQYFVIKILTAHETLQKPPQEFQVATEPVPHCDHSDHGSAETFDDDSDERGIMSGREYRRRRR